MQSCVYEINICQSLINRALFKTDVPAQQHRNQQNKLKIKMRRVEYKCKICAQQ